MLRAYVSAGFDPAAFWELSPRLYLIQMQGARKRLEAEHENRAWLAWHVEALRRCEKMPDLQKFVAGKAAQPKTQSPEVLQAMCNALATAWDASGKE